MKPFFGLKMMDKRKAISKKTRFEIFKRDSFTCQYCGAHPPLVVLEVDHIEPVFLGGTNDLDNLITACFDCNRGKSNRELSNVPQSLQDKAAQVLEREAQINGYQAVLKAKQARIEDEAEQVRKVYEIYNEGFTLSDPAMIRVKFFVDKLGFYEVKQAMEIAHSKRQIKNQYSYFCGICWTKMRAS